MMREHMLQVTWPPPESNHMVLYPNQPPCDLNKNTSIQLSGDAWHIRQHQQVDKGAALTGRSWRCARRCGLFLVAARRGPPVNGDPPHGTVSWVGLKMLAAASPRYLPRLAWTTCSRSCTAARTFVTLNNAKKTQPSVESTGG